jgi:hypothetical protein
MRLVRRLVDSYTEVFRGATTYLQSVILAVLLAPVLPDIAVDAFGDVAPAWLLRILAALGLFVLCCVAYWWSRRTARKRAANAGVKLRRPDPCDVLVLGLSLGKEPHFRLNRTGDAKISEHLLDAVKPSTVILIASPAVNYLDETQRNIESIGKTVHLVQISDAYDPGTVLREIPDKVREILHHHKLLSKRIYVDITGGTAVMSVAMLRLALIVKAKAAYVWSDWHDGKRVPDSERSITFDPRDALPNPDILPSLD